VIFYVRDPDGVTIEIVERATPDVRVSADAARAAVGSGAEGA
jgi:hypothetical protein